MFTFHIPRRHRALVIALSYAVFAALWILLSDRVVGRLFPGNAAETQAQTWKGWGFVAITAFLLYLVIRSALRAELAEQARRQEAEDLIRIVLDTIPGMVVWKDRHSRYLGGNRVALREAGLRTSREFIGLTDEDLPWRDNAPQLRERDEIILRGEADRLDYEVVIDTAEGKRRDQAVIKLPLRDASGAITGVVVFSEDLTERRLAERQLRLSQKSQVISELTRGVTHDFKNVLSVIISNAELMEGLLPNGATEARAATADILSVSHNAAAMVRKLLSFSRQDEVTIESVDLAARIEALAPVLSKLLPAGAQLDMSLPRDLPRVFADPDALEQMLVNVAMNAREVTEVGGKVEIKLVGPISLGELQVTAPNRRVVLAPDDTASGTTFVGVLVTDQGPGMSTAVSDRIFEPYFSTRVGVAGTGLGLSMVHGLMVQHTGVVTLRTSMGHGATFGLYFPVDMVGVPAAAAPQAATPTSSEASGETILLVDDQPELRRVGGRVLRRFGYRVLEAESGVQALEIFGREGPQISLVLTDLLMPGMNGLELLAEIRATGSKVPVALSSGDPNLAAKAGAANQGPVPMISKPWTMEDLGEGVRQLLRESNR